MDAEQRQHLQELRGVYQKRLRVLELQAANKGQDTPPHIQLEIKDLKGRIADLDAELAGKRRPPTDQPRTYQSRLKPWHFTLMLIALLSSLSVNGLLLIRNQEGANPIDAQTHFTASPATTSTSGTATSPTINYILQPGFEGDWVQETTNNWRMAYWTPYRNDRKEQVSYLFPERDVSNVYAGKISCRIDGPGDYERAYLTHITIDLPSKTNFNIKFWYKTQGNVSLKLFIKDTDNQNSIIFSGENIQNSDTFDSYENSFSTQGNEGTPVKAWIHFTVQGQGKVWIDEVLLTPTSQ